MAILRGTMDTRESVVTVNPSSPRTPRHWPRLVVVALAAAALWLLEFWYQYYVYVPGDFGAAWVRSSSLTGATLLSLALLSSALFKWVPRLAGQYRWRRNLGVAGFTFISLHILGVLQYYVGWNVLSLLYVWQPFQNPVIFGLVAYVIVLGMALTSTEWAVRQLKKWWKFLHRFIYLAEVGIIFHALLLGGPVLQTPPGYVLYALGGAALVGQVYWWGRISQLRKFKNAGFWVGLALLVLVAVLWYLGWR